MQHDEGGEKKNGTKAETHCRKRFYRRFYWRVSPVSMKKVASLCEDFSQLQPAIISAAGSWTLQTSKYISRGIFIDARLNTLQKSKNCATDIWPLSCRFDLYIVIFIGERTSNPLGYILTRLWLIFGLVISVIFRPKSNCKLFFFFCVRIFDENVVTRISNKNSSVTATNKFFFPSCKYTNPWIFLYSLFQLMTSTNRAAPSLICKCQICRQHETINPDDNLMTL